MGLHTTSRIKRINTSTSLPGRLIAGGVVGTLALGGVVAVSAQKDVILDVNGEQQTLSTFSRDVAGVLAAAEVQIGDDDLVYPAPSESISDDGTITVRTAKPVALVIDGEATDLTSTALTVEDLLNEIDDLTPAAQIEQDGHTRLTEGMRVEVTTPKIVAIDDAGAVTYTSIAARTVGDVLAERGIELGGEDIVSPAPDSPVANNMNITVDRVEIDEHTETVEFEVEPDYLDDPNSPEGTETVVEAGTPGTREVTHRITTVNGEETDRELIDEVELTPATPATVKRGTAASAPSVAGGSVWDALAQCESNGNWSINTGNGYHGGLQFSPSTWNGYGGQEFAAAAYQASREQQIAVAQRVQQGQGWGAWPACTAKLGIR